MRKISTKILILVMSISIVLNFTMISSSAASVESIVKSKISVNIPVPFVIPTVPPITGTININTNIKKSSIQILTPVNVKIDRNTNHKTIYETPVFKVRVGIEFEDEYGYYQTAVRKFSWKKGFYWDWSSRKKIFKF